jgi:ectoine hydroxylase-related dioxygenase (phytanoyl-CoA dioxygenase family)
MDNRTTITIDQYRRFREDGFLIVRGVLDDAEVDELLDHGDELLAADPDLLRVHMLHRRLEIHERYLLHPRIVDVVAGLIGPDVLALQTMLFVKGPGSEGQGYHQDSYHIITQPDTLIGAWVALDRADTENGCVWITPGSQNEPVYPDADVSRGHGGDVHLADIEPVAGADDPDEARNGLTPVAGRYAGREVPAVLEPGDAVVFGGHVLHRSHANRSATRSRRAFVVHYCNARSCVPWDDEPLEPGAIANDRHILARGTTPLPHGRPRFAHAVRPSTNVSW